MTDFRHAEPDCSSTAKDSRYGLWLLSSSSLRCDCSLIQCASNDSIGSLPLTDSNWFVRVESDNARISSRISASRSGGLGDMLIYVRDVACLRFCLLLLPVAQIKDFESVGGMMPVWLKNTMQALAAIILTAAGMTEVRRAFPYSIFTRAQRVTFRPI